MKALLVALVVVLATSVSSAEDNPTTTPAPEDLMIPLEHVRVAQAEILPRYSEERYFRHYEVRLPLNKAYGQLEGSLYWPARSLQDALAFLDVLRTDRASAFRVRPAYRGYKGGFSQVEPQEMTGQEIYEHTVEALKMIWIPCTTWCRITGLVLK